MVDNIKPGRFISIPASVIVVCQVRECQLPAHFTEIWQRDGLAFNVYLCEAHHKRSSHNTNCGEWCKEGTVMSIEIEDLKSRIKSLEGLLTITPADFGIIASVLEGTNSLITEVEALRDLARQQHEALEKILVEFTAEHMDSVSGTNCGTNARDVLALYHKVMGE